MKSAVIKRSVVVDGHKTSVSLENEFWEGLREIAERQSTSLSTLVGRIDQERNNCNLSSAIRVFVFSQIRAGKQGSAEAAKSPEGGLNGSGFAS